MRRAAVSRGAVAARIPAEGFFPGDSREQWTVLVGVVAQYLFWAGDIRRRARDQRWPAGVMPAVFAALNRELKARLGDIYEGRVDTVGMLGARMRELGIDPEAWIAQDRHDAGLLLGYWLCERTQSPFFIFRLFARIAPYSPDWADLPRRCTGYRYESPEGVRGCHLNSDLAWEYIHTLQRRGREEQALGGRRGDGDNGSL
jgi:hypothetical protein